FVRSLEFRRVLFRSEHGYRMRARFHVHCPRAGFYREGTHQLCDAAATRQLRGESIRAVEGLAATLDRHASGRVTSIAISENVEGAERAAHLEVTAGGVVHTEVLERAAAAAGLRGVSARDASTGRVAIGGTPAVVE